MNEEEAAVDCLEQFNCRYICTLCKPFKQVESNKYGNLETHYLTQHKDQEITTCPYCLCHIQISSISSHINSHFKKEIKNPYICPICPISKPTLKCVAHHAFEEHQITNIDLFRRCGHCEKLTRDISDLINHLESAKITLYHCTFPGCVVKSKSLDHVKSHVTRCHQADMNSISQSVDFICSWPLQQQPLVDATALNIANQINGLNSFVDQAISLTCSFCPYTTLNMEKFAQHLATCKFAIQAGNFLSISCVLYKCPICLKPSTSSDMVKEHLAITHNQKDYNKSLAQEDLTVPIDEILAKEASMSFLNGTLNGKSLSDSVFPNLGDIDSIKKAILDIVNPGNNNPSTNNQIPISIKQEQEPEVTLPGELLKTQTTGKTVLPTHLTNGQPVEEWVDLFFHESEFLAAFHKAKLTSDLQDFTDARLPENLMKLKHFGKLKVPIMGRANQRRVAACPVCNKNFNHGFSDLKKHLMVGHMEMSREISRFAINFTHSPKFATIQIPNINKSLSSSGPLQQQQQTPPTAKQNNQNSTNSLGKKADGDNYSTKFGKIAPLDGNLLGGSNQEQITNFNMPPISSELECQDVKNHVEASTIEEAESLRPPGRGGIVPLDENGQPLSAALEATLSDEEIASFEVFKPVLGRQRIALAYSMGVLKKLFQDHTYSYSEKLHIINRLNRYSRMYVFMDMSAQGMNYRRYCCAVCSYNSQHSLADVRKHVMGSHCGISPKRFRICLRSSRHESTHFRLCSDEKMLQYVDLRTSKGQSNLSSTTNGSGNTIGATTMTSNNNNTTATNTTGNSSNPSSNKTFNEDEDFVDDFGEMSSTTINESLNATTPGNGIISHHHNISNNSFSSSLATTNPTSTPKMNGNSSSITLTSSSLSQLNNSSTTLQKDDLNTLLAEQAKLTHHKNNPYDGVQFTSHNGTPIVLREGETGQRIDLPWSENVLLALMNNDRYKSQINGVLKKMTIYANYHLIVVTKERRIHAYICVCGRRFSVVREDEDNDMRPASLADCRRHVLGVHARVSQDMLTLCCQASRISRESNYQLYADKSLLALAEHHKIRTSKTSLDFSSRSDVNSSLNDSNNNAAMMIGQSQQQQQQRHPGTSLPATSLLTFDQGKELAIKYGLPDHWRLERIVNLVYSPEVFNQLLSRQSATFEEDFVAGLHEKMLVYCDYSVYIFRQDTSKQKNQKFYACSACLSASPHGLGDMRKHILGVHAHIPEKIKSAAMAAGRLNRDNFGLYSDDQLISMAMMGGRSMTSSSSTSSSAASKTPVSMVTGQNNLTEGLKSLGSTLLTSMRKRESFSPIMITSTTDHNNKTPPLEPIKRPRYSNNNTTNNEMKRAGDQPPQASSSSTVAPPLETYQSVWPGQQTEDEYAANELSNGLEDDDDDEEEGGVEDDDDDETPANTNGDGLGPDGSIEDDDQEMDNNVLDDDEDEDDDNDDNSQLMLSTTNKTTPLEIDETPSPVQSNTPPRRPPIILNLKLSKLMNNTNSKSATVNAMPGSNPESTNSSPFTLTHDEMSSTLPPTSRSRRSIMLKSKKPLPTSN